MVYIISDDLKMIASPHPSNSTYLFSHLASKLFQLSSYPNFLPLHFSPRAQTEQQRAAKPSQNYSDTPTNTTS